MANTGPAAAPLISGFQREAGISLPVYGIIDLVRPGPVTVDFKTVGATPNPEIDNWLHERQLTAYALLVESATGQRVERSEIVHLVRTKQPKVIAQSIAARGPVQRERFTRLVDTYSRGVRDEEYYPCPGQQCAWCPFRSECNAWRGIQSCRAS